MESRKKDHIELTLQSQLTKDQLNKKFNYEPALQAHPINRLPEQLFLGKTLKMPVWVSSMTGGTAIAKQINTQLAKVCKEFGMGMGLGSCRPLLASKERFDDFNIRPIIGNELPLLANLGIAQIEHLLQNKELDKLQDLIQSLEVDGLFVHLNPMQEFLQPEGDTIRFSPIETIQKLLSQVDFPIFVKEVGQGMGHESLKALLQLNIAGLEFGAFGGTNFARMELLRSEEMKYELLSPLASIGHTAEEMVDFLNQMPKELLKGKEIIISGGVSDWLEGYYLIKKLNHPALFGQASAFLKYAKTDYKQLQTYVEYIQKGLLIANSYLTIRH
ncbi:MAG: type 2 isopentenyl-diphosphate Delta-isomerase [Bacteroidales bacterium]|nr:type 2 isopentenyl-diphosphate Delta-isomerase [Bacteroidales bacterium]